MPPGPKQTYRHYVIQVAKPWHRGWWAAHLGVSEAVLLDAVRQVGSQASAVEDFLRRPDRQDPERH